MTDFQITVGGDFSEILRGFQQLESKAAQSGAKAGQGLAEGIQGFSSRSIAALQAELSRLQQRQTRVAIDSSAFDKAGARIREIEGLLAAVQRKQLSLNVDDRSISALRARLGELQGELERVQIGSQRFRELTAAIQSTERELAKAGDSADGFRILDGVVQGVAFSLSNAVVSGAQQALAALGNVVSEYARLDTELRKAAAASGEKGAYESLARSVEQVGIEAAGTTMEVAQLNTELIRGGMTVDQANASLKSIVRGAEATGTSFATMGSVVSASIKGFGLQASDATRVVDALVQGANASAASVEGMGMSFKYAAPVAKILGVSVEDLGIAIGLMTNAGIDASEAGVTLRNGLSKLASAAPATNGAVKKLTGQAAEAADAMKGLGINIYNTDGTLKPMKDTLLQLKGAFDKLDPSTKIRLAANLFGGEDDGTKWLALLNQSQDEIIKMAGAMASTKGATDVARDAMQGFEMKLKALDGSLGAIGNTFGMVAASALMPFIDLANQVVGAIVALPGPVKTLVAGLTLLTGAYVAATIAQVAFARAVGTKEVQDAIGGVKALALELGKSFSTNAKLAAVSIAGLIKEIKNISFASIAGTIDKVVIALRDNLASGASAARAAFAQLANSIKGGGFTAALGQIGAFGLGLAKVALIAAPLAAALAILTAAIQGITNASERFKKANEQVKNALNALDQQLNKTATNAQDKRQILQAIFEGMRDGFQVLNDVGFAQKLKSSFQSLTADAQEFANSLATTGSVSADQANKAKAFALALDTTSQTAKELATEYTALAAEQTRLTQTGAAEKYQKLAAEMTSAAKNADTLSAAIIKKAGITAQDIVDTGKAIAITKDRAEAEKELARIISEAPIRNLESQLAVGQQLSTLARALADQEQSRYDIAKARGQFELSEAERRGASEGRLRAIRQNNDQIEAQSLAAKYAALQQQQQLEQVMLQLSQEKQRIEANLAVLTARNQLLKEQAQLSAAQTAGDQTAIALAQSKVAIATQQLGLEQNKVNLLSRTQPLEQLIAQATAETANNALQAQAASKGWEISQGAVYKSSQGLSQQIGQMALTTKTAADGSVIITQEFAKTSSQAQSVNKLLAGAVGSSDQFSRSISLASTGFGTASTAADNLSRNVQVTAAAATSVANQAGLASTKVNDLSKGTQTASGQFQSTAKAAEDAAKATSEIGNNASDGARKSKPLEDALNSTSKSASAIATVKMAENLSRASGSAGSLKNAMVAALVAAKEFFIVLSKASGLPGSRWTGGPVDAGNTYRINELGQEAFLRSSGRVSLINRPANSLWTAPSKGVVIPAGITDQLKSRGVFNSRSASRGTIAARESVIDTRDMAANMARQALAIGKLQESVDQLVAKDWNVQVRVRNTTTGATYLDTLNRMR